MANERRDSRGEHERMEHAGAARYWLTWAALVIGTIATLLMSRVELGHPWHLLVALFIACAKSALVVLFFMHLWDHAGANRLVFGTSVFFVVLLIGLVVLDNATRFQLANPGNEEIIRLQPPGPDLLSPREPLPAEGRGAQKPEREQPR